MNSPLRMATEFEYRHRFGIVALIYLLTYALYNVDSTNIVWALSHWDRAHHIPLDRQVFSVAALIAAIGVAVWTWAKAYSPTGSDMSPLSSERFIADGPYRYVRHPIYFGCLLLTIGLGFFQSRLGVTVLIPLEGLFLYRLIQFEESQLREHYGDAYVAYSRNVPIFLPGLHRHAAVGAREPRWRLAIIHDIPLWGWVVTLIAFVVTLNDKVGYRFALATICVWIALRAYSSLFSKTAPPSQ